MKTKLLKLYSASILKLLTFLGFMTVTGCVAMYGVEIPCENMDLTVRGNVSSKETGLPIEGVQVIALCSWGHTTDEKGNFETKIFSSESLFFRDPTGNHEDLDTLINSQGEASKTVNIQLRPRETNNNETP